MSEHCKELWDVFLIFGGTFECTTGRYGDECKFWTTQKNNQYMYSCDPSKEFINMINRSPFHKIKSRDGYSTTIHSEI